jgi:hypothetical protein
MTPASNIGRCHETLQARRSDRLRAPRAYGVVVVVVGVVDVVVVCVGVVDVWVS